MPGHYVSKMAYDHHNNIKKHFLPALSFIMNTCRTVKNPDYDKAHAQQALKIEK